MEISDIVSDENPGFKRIVDFMNIWYSSSKNKDSLVLFYEEIKKNPHQEFEKLLNFLGEDQINQNALLKAIDETFR